MKRNVIGSATIVAFALLLAPASAQDAAKGGGGAAGASGAAGQGGGAAAGGEGSQRLLPKTGGTQGAGEASPGMKPAAGASTASGQRNEGENVGVSPAQQPTVPGEPANARKGTQNEDRPTGKNENAQPGKQPNGQAKQGQEGGAGKQAGQARPAPEITSVQQTKIQQTIKTVNVAPVRVDFHVGVGVAVPRTVVLTPLPPTIIGIVPEYEGFRFFVVPGEIVIVDPVTLEIVAVLPL